MYIGRLNRLSPLSLFKTYLIPYMCDIYNIKQTHVIDKFSKRPPCFCNWSFNASKVKLPLCCGSASSNIAIVRSSICCSENSIPFSLIQALMTSCSSLCWIKPSPVQSAIERKKERPIISTCDQLISNTNHLCRKLWTESEFYRRLIVQRIDVLNL